MTRGPCDVIPFCYVTVLIHVLQRSCSGASGPDRLECCGLCWRTCCSSMALRPSMALLLPLVNGRGGQKWKWKWKWKSSVGGPKSDSRNSEHGKTG